MARLRRPRSARSPPAMTSEPSNRAAASVATLAGRRRSASSNVISPVLGAPLLAGSLAALAGSAGHSGRGAAAPSTVEMLVELTGWHDQDALPIRSMSMLNGSRTSLRPERCGFAAWLNASHVPPGLELQAREMACVVARRPRKPVGPRSHRQPSPTHARSAVRQERSTVRAGADSSRFRTKSVHRESVPRRRVEIRHALAR
jgi:hypothetical protein